VIPHAESVKREASAIDAGESFMAHLDIERADFGLLEALVLSGQMEDDQVIRLMHQRPDFASRFTNRARQRQSRDLRQLPIAAE
jgi:hypothetical protein